MEVFGAAIEDHRHSMLALSDNYDHLPIDEALERIFRRQSRWAIDSPFTSELVGHLVFKSSTSLSMGYDVIEPPAVETVVARRVRAVDIRAIAPARFRDFAGSVGHAVEAA